MEEKEEMLKRAEKVADEMNLSKEQKQIYLKKTKTIIERKESKYYEKRLAKVLQ